MREDRVRYKKEELAARVRVPVSVEQELRQIVSDRLEQCGLYFRVYSRIKTAVSLEHKFEFKEYGGEKKVQDLVGVRINLYFDDDVNICKEIMDNTFDVVEWAATECSDSEFKPAKLNGVFKLPHHLKEQISRDTWEMSIDDTFEIQIKTMFFEGWHEIEHDMRYKGGELWTDFDRFSRYLNSILATLELCDKSMVTLFEDLGHAMYKAGRWQDMVRSHFRLQIGTTPIYPEVEELLDLDMERVDNLGKRIYKTSKAELVRYFTKRNRRIPINVNTIIATLNDNKFHDSRLTAIFKERDVYNDGREESVGESRHYELRPLIRHTVFQMNTVVDGSRMKTEVPITSNLIFERAADYIYQWIVMKYGNIFKEMPQETSSFHADVLAYHVAVNFSKEQCRMNFHVRHMDLEVGGRIWYSEGGLERNPEGKIILKLLNGYAEPDWEDQARFDGTKRLFSYPGYYKAIADNVGLFNGISCSNRRRILKKEELLELKQALENTKRQFPIILICSRNTAEGRLDESWLQEFRVSEFTKSVWRYAHVLSCNEEVGQEFFRLMGMQTPDGSVAEHFYIFWPDKNVEIFGTENVRNCSFGRHLEARGDARTYSLVRGGQAFYHKIMTELRDWNVAASMWEGFKLEIMTEILK